MRHPSRALVLGLLFAAPACKSDEAGGDGGGTDTDGTGTDGGSTGGTTATTGDPVRVDLQGAVNKGPFVLGSSLDISPLDAEGNPTGEVFQTSTISDLGEFAISFETTGLVRIEGDGFYYNEVTGELSDAPITLRALYEVTAAGEQDAFVNLVTHLSHERILKLIGDGMTPADATAQAETELRTGLAVGPADLDIVQQGVDLNINGGDDLGNAYLLAVSSVLAQAAIERAGPDGSVDAALQELVNGISVDLQADGELSTATIDALSDAESALDPERVMELLGQRLSDLGSAETVPDVNRVLDTDDDTVVNRDDNCRWIPNPEQAPITDQICLVLARGAGEATDAQMSLAGDAVVADLDGDGSAEVVAARDGAVRVFTVADGGVLTEAASVTGVDVVSLEAADVDGDGNVDLVGFKPDMGGGGAGELVTMSGAGTLQPGSPVSTAGLANWGSWGDLDGDGQDDLISLFPSGAFNGTTAELTHAAAISNGDGTFTISDRVITIPTTDLDSDPATVGAADLDGDGVIDLGYTAAGPSGGVLIVASGDGSGAFGSPVNTDLPGNVMFGSIDAGGVSLQIGDATGDGNPDLVGLGGGQLHVFPGDGAGNFSAPVSSSFEGAQIDGGGAMNLGIGDATGDGVPEVIASMGLPELAVAVGTGNGAFAAPVPVASHLLESVEGRGFGDVDGNGTMDMVAVVAPNAGVMAASFLINP